MTTIVVLACAACGTGAAEANAPVPTRAGGPAPATDDPTTSPAAGTTDPGPTTGAVDHTDPLAVYTAWWTALEAAYAKGDADAPLLAEYAVDPILARQRASIAALRGEGIVQRTRFTLAPRLRYATGRNAEVEDCVRGPAGTYRDAVTGLPRAPRGYRNDVPTEDRLLTTLQRRGDQWYVVAATGRGEIEC